jgi:hypothetical protein
MFLTVGPSQCGAEALPQTRGVQKAVLHTEMPPPRGALRTRGLQHLCRWGARM